VGGEGVAATRASLTAVAVTGGVGDTPPANRWRQGVLLQVASVVGMLPCTWASEVWPRYGEGSKFDLCRARSLHQRPSRAWPMRPLSPPQCAQGPDGKWNKYGGRLAWDASAICSNNPAFGGRGNPKQGDDYAAAPNIDHSQVCVCACVCVCVRACVCMSRLLLCSCLLQVASSVIWVGGARAGILASEAALSRQLHGLLSRQLHGHGHQHRQHVRGHWRWQLDDPTHHNQLI